MKVIISNRIYLVPEDPQALKSALTYKFTKKFTGGNRFAAVETVKTYKALPKGVFSIPAGRRDLIPAGSEIVDKTVYDDIPFPEPLFPLREDQQKVYDAVTGSCFINAMVGWGKTFMALHLARKLHQKTLIITHTTNLRDQWIDEYTTLYGSKCGVIGSGVFDIEDHCLVVGNIQSLVKYKDQIAKEFGTVILDEAHHCPASTFTEFIDCLHARYRIGLSGTMIRKDSKHVLFKDYFGDVVFQPAVANTLIPKIRRVKTGITLSPGKAWVDKISDLVNDMSYVRVVASAALMQMARGHSVLVIADRVEFLENIANEIGESCVLVTGKSTKEERDRAKEQLLSREKLCVAGSRQIFSEGISINVLSCVILAVPMNNDSLLEQIIGRVQRNYDELKPQPLVIDMIFSGYADRVQNDSRLGLYLRKGWEVTTV